MEISAKLKSILTLAAKTSLLVMSAVGIISVSACEKNANVAAMAKLVGIANPATESTLDVGPDVADFGTASIGQPPRPALITAQNKGTGVDTLYIADITADNLHFAISSDVPSGVDDNGCIGKAIAPGEKCTFGIQYVPISEGVETSIFNVTWGKSKGDASQKATVKGTGRGVGGKTDQLVFNSDPAEFGNVIPGSISKKSVTVAINIFNQAAKPAYIKSFAMTSSDFAITGNGCPIAPAILAPGADCTLYATMAPSVAGDVTGKLRVNFGARAGTFGYTSELSLHGTALDPTKAINAALSFTPTSWDFTGNPINTTATPKIIVVNNSAIADVYIGSIAVSSSPTDYTISGNTCPQSPTPLAVGSTCQFTINFTATTAGPRPDFVDVNLGFSHAASSGSNVRFIVTGLGQSFLNFAGITSIPAEQIGGQSLVVTWDLETTGVATTYKVYTVDNSGNTTYKAQVSTPATQTTVTGLTPGTTYKLRVKAVDQWSSEDHNTLDLTATTLAYAPPILTSLSPAFGSLSGNNAVTLTGTGFRSGVTVTIGGAACSSLVVVSSTQITCRTPTHAAGVVPVVVTNVDAQASTVVTGYEYRVSFSGITSVDQITGSAMRLNWTSSADAVSYNVYQVVSGTPNYIGTVVAPAVFYSTTGLTANTSYTWRVRAVTSTGVMDSNTGGDVTRTTLPNPAPTITSVTPSSGKVAGGTTITLTGTGFLGGATINLGSSACTSVSIVSGTSATCVAPANANGGPVNVVLTNSDAQIATLASGYTFYMSFPGASSITTPTSGVQLTVNWALVTDAIDSYQIFTVSGGGVPTFIASVASNVASYTATNLTPGTTYKLRVRAYNNAGANDGNTNDLSATTLANVPPTLTVVSPTTGVISGGTTITLTGSGFVQSPAPTITIGGTACTSVTWVSATSATCVTPVKGIGTYDVVFINNDSQSATLTNGFRFSQFAGLASIDQIGGTSMRLNWTASADGATYQIYEISSGTSTPIASIPTTGSGNTMHYTVTGLTTATAHTYRVRATDTGSVQDANLVDRTGTTLGNVAPTLTGISPTTGVTTGNTIVTLTGTGFLNSSPNVTLGGNPCSTVTWISSTSLTCVTPANAVVGAYDGVIANSDGQSGTLTNGFRYTTFAGLASIDQILSTTMRLNWTATAVGASYQVYSISGGTPTLVQSVVSPGAGAMTYTVTGLSINTSYIFRVRETDNTTFQENNSVDRTTSTLTHAAPTISAITPVSTLLAGTGTLTATGTGFLTGMSITIGSGGSFTSCTAVNVASLTSATCTLPAKSAGLYDVLVTNTDTQGATLASAIAYQTFAGITSISSIGGTSMTANWSADTGSPAAYRVYTVSGGTLTLKTQVTAPATSAIITGLTANTSYTLRVRSVDSSGNEDRNNVDSAPTSTMTYAPPVISSISPAYGPLQSGTALTITGTGFRAGATVNIAASLCTGLSVVSLTQITCTAPAGSAGVVTVTVANSDAQSAMNITGYEYRVTFGGLASIDQRTGAAMRLNWTATADAVSYNVYKVVSGTPTFVGSSASPATTYTATGLTNNTSYTWRVRAVASNGVMDSNTTDVTQSTLANAPPTITGVSPASPRVGIVSGGSQTLTLTGTNFAAGGSITVNSQACSSFTYVSATSVTCTLPAQAAGSKTVIYTGADTQTASSTGLTYQISFGGTDTVTPVGGNTAQINWTTTTDAASYTVYTVSGGVATSIATIAAPATNYIATGLTVATPYTFRVRAFDAWGGTDSNTSDVLITTLANPAPTITAVSPTAGQLAGTGTLTVTGGGLRSGLAIDIGDGSTWTSCTSVSVGSLTSATCTIPTKTTGLYHVRVKNTDNQNGTLNNAYTYRAAPTITSLSPASGDYLGGQTITLTGTGFVNGASVLLGPTTTVTNATSSGTTAITLGGAPSTTLTVGMGVTGNGIPAGAKISALASQTSFTLSAAATSSVSGNLSLTFGIRCDSPNVSSATTLTCTTGPNSSPTVWRIVDVKVFNQDLQSGTLLSSYTYTLETVSLLAGSPYYVGCADGSSLATMRFSGTINALKYDSATNSIYVVEATAGMIRKLDLTNSTLSLVAGQRCNNSSSTDGSSSSAVLQNPNNMVKVGTKIFFTESNSTNSGNRLRMIDTTTGNATTIVGAANAGPDDGNGLAASIWNATGITANDSGTYLYITEIGGHTIRRISTSPPYTVTTIAGFPGLVADSDFPYTPPTITMAAGTTTNSTTAITLSSAPSTPVTVGMAVTGGGYNPLGYVTTVTDTTHFVVSVAAVLANTTKGAQFLAPSLSMSATTTTSSQVLTVADTTGLALGMNVKGPNFGCPTNGFIMALTATTITTNCAWTASATNTVYFYSTLALSSPRDVVFYKPGSGTCSTNGCLLVSMQGTHTIKYIVLAADGTASSSGTLAGKRNSQGYLDGIGTAAIFDTPSQLAVIGNNLYVSTGSNPAYVIRKIDMTTFASPIVTTVAGLPGTTQITDGATFGSIQLGSTTTASKVVTGLITSVLAVGDSVAGTGLTTQTIASIDSTSQITLSANCTSTTASNSLTFSSATRSVARIQGPQGLTAVGTDLYFADESFTIRKLDTTTNVISTYAGTNPQYKQLAATDNSNATPGLTDQPSYARFGHANVGGGLASDGTNVYYTNTQCCTYKIRMINGSTGWTTTPVSVLTNVPGGLVYDPASGVLYVADGNMIRMVQSPSGTPTVTTIANTANTLATVSVSPTDGTAATATFNSPQGMVIVDVGGTHYLYIGEAAGARIRRMTIPASAGAIAGFSYTVSTVAGNNITTLLDGSGTSAGLRVDSAMAYGTYTIGATTYKKIYFTNTWTLRSLDLDTNYVETITSTTTGYQDTALPAANLTDTLSAKAIGIYGIAWDGSNLVYTDRENSAIRRYDPITGTVRTLLSTEYVNQTKNYTAGNWGNAGWAVNGWYIARPPYFDSATTKTVTAGTAAVTAPLAIIYDSTLGFIIGNSIGVWKAN